MIQTITHAMWLAVRDAAIMTAASPSVRSIHSAAMSRGTEFVWAKLPNSAVRASRAIGARRALEQSKSHAALIRMGVAIRLQ